MKRYLLLLCLTLAVAIQASPDNAEKSQVPLADPYILLDGDTYYAYGTHADNGIECYTSTDLKSWHYAGLALQRGNTTETRWFWAPEVYKFDSKYYMYYSANEHLYVATADTPAGPFKQVGTYMMDKVLGSEKCIDSSLCSLTTTARSGYSSYASLTATASGSANSTTTTSPLMPPH